MRLGNVIGYLHGHDSSACLVQDGKIVAFVEEERLCRQKHAVGIFPIQSIRACVRIGGITISEVDRFAFGYDAPRFANGEIGEFYDRINRQYPPDELTRSWQLANLKRHASATLKHTLSRELKKEFGSLPFADLSFYPHHLSHAVAAYHLSPFEDALILVVDGSGDHQCTSIWRGIGEDITPLHEINMPHSLGWFYSAITEFLGFEAYDGEYKVMGLAAYGNPNPALREKLGRLLVPLDGARGYELTRNFIHSGNHSYSSRFTDDLIGLLGIQPRSQSDPIEPIHEDLAFEAQRALEQVTVALLRHFSERTGCRHIAIGGGVGQNVKLNAAVRDSGLFDDVFLFPIPSDSGTAAGAALGVSQRDFGSDIRNPMPSMLLGVEYSDDEIEKELSSTGIAYTKVNDIADTTAELLERGFLVGWFQGRMEAGPRALGARSILADPRRAASRDQVNAAVKYREYWRPFCPSIATEATLRYVGEQVEAPYMIMAFSATEEARKTIPAVVHVDGTMRIQTVDRRSSPLFHNLLLAFEKRTGVAAVLNTSFNIKGEPLVCSPRDALRTFWSTGLDVLAIGSFIVKKPRLTELS